MVSTPGGIIGFFYRLNHSGPTMDLGWTHPLSEMSTPVISWGVKAAGA